MPTSPEWYQRKRKDPAFVAYRCKLAKEYRRRVRLGLIQPKHRVRREDCDIFLENLCCE